MEVVRYAIPYVKVIGCTLTVLGGVCGAYIGMREMDTIITTEKKFRPHMGFIPLYWSVVGAVVGGTGMFFPWVWMSEKMRKSR